MDETLKNLHKAFAGESQARNRYAMYAKQAKKEGFEQIASIFEETADQEREHAKQLSKMFGETKTNLKGAIAGETYETSTMYPEFATQAKNDGLEEIAKRLMAIGVAEIHHAQRYQKLSDLVEAGKVFEKDDVKQWVCRKCGYVHTGRTPPEECPACSHKEAYYQIKSEEY